MAKEKPSFSALAKKVFQESLPESDWGKSVWTGKSNIVWATVSLGDNFFGYFIIQRNAEYRITGELAVSRGTDDPGFFFPLHNPMTGEINPPQKGYRERLGWLMEKRDIWWPCSCVASA